jgi:hypothetical protein
MSTPENGRVNFIYKLGGDLGEIDVFALAPTLLALGQLIQEGNRTLYPDGKQIAVNVKPFREGSFIVDVSLFPTEAIYPILALAKDIPPAQILAVLGFIGIAKTTGLVARTTNSVLDVIRKLKGKPSKIEELKPGEVRYSSDNNSITVNGEVHQLMQNPQITQNIYNVYGKPLEDTKFEDVESYLESEPEDMRMVVTREDLPALKSSATVTPLEEQTKERILTDVVLNPKRGAFEGDGASWSFHRGDDVITATVRDQKFLRAIELGEIRPNHSDLMTVTLKETQKVIGTKVKTPKYEIMEVADYKVGARQMRIDLPTGEPLAILSAESKALPPAPDTSESDRNE